MFCFALMHDINRPTICASPDPQKPVLLADPGGSLWTQYRGQECISLNNHRFFTIILGVVAPSRAPSVSNRGTPFQADNSKEAFFVPKIKSKTALE